MRINIRNLDVFALVVVVVVVVCFRFRLAIYSQSDALQQLDLIELI